MSRLLPLMSARRETPVSAMATRISAVRTRMPLVRRVTGAVLIATAVAVFVGVADQVQRLVPSYVTAAQGTIEDNASAREALGALSGPRVSRPEAGTVAGDAAGLGPAKSFDECEMDPRVLANCGQATRLAEHERPAGSRIGVERVGVALGHLARRSEQALGDLRPPATEIRREGRANASLLHHANRGESDLGVVVIREGIGSLEPSDELEDDMLDKAWGLEPDSRLSCQAVVASADLVVEIPRYTINQVSEGH